MLPPEDDVFTVRENVDEQDEDEQEAVVESPRKKKAKLEEEAPPKDAGWVDLDVGDEDDPLMVSEYVNEVYDYLLEVEVSVTSCSFPYRERELNHCNSSSTEKVSCACQLHGHPDGDHLADARHPRRLAD